MSATPTSAVFLSYASQDAAAARCLCEALRAAGIEVWFDQSELVGGDAWDAKIRKQIGMCALFVPILSANTQAREEGYFRLEWKLAAQRTHMMTEEKAFVLPVVIDGTRDADAKVPAEFRAVQWTRLPEGQTTQSFIERVRKLLAGSILEVGRPRPVERGADAASPAGPMATPKVGRAIRARLGLAAASLAVLLAVVAGVLLTRKDAPAARHSAPPAAENPVTDEKSVAVLPFANVGGEKDNEAISDGITDELISRLGRVPGLTVKARTSSFFFKGSSAPAREKGQKLGATYLVDGSVRRLGDRMRITAQLIRAATEENVWTSEPITDDTKDVFAVQEKIAGLITQALSLKLGASSPAATSTVNPEAFRHYLEGRQEWNRRTMAGYKRAEHLFERAIALDSNLAQAYVGLADSLHLQNQMLDAQDQSGSSDLRARLLALLDRALTLEPTLAEAHVSRAQILERDEDAREAGLRRGLALNPSYATGRHWLALSLGRQGRFEASMAEARLALQLDPLSPAIHAACALVFNHSHRWAEALDMAERSQALQPDISYAFGNRVRALLGLNRSAEALALLRADTEDRTNNASFIAYLAMAGDRDTAGRHATGIFANPAGRNPVGVFELYVALGRTDEALGYLERHVAGVLRNVGEIMAPMFDDVRQDPRFIRAVEAAGMTDRYTRAQAELLAARKRLAKP